jgi:hypothetical protein
MSEFRLSDAQVRQFKTFGFLSFPGLLADRAEAIIDAFERVFQEKGGGHAGRKHDGKARSCVTPFIDQSEYLSSLLDDERIDGILTGLVGADYNYGGSDGNYYVGETWWHSDGWRDEMTFVKIAFYLDSLTRTTGALRVIPASHRVGTPYADELERNLRRSDDEWGIGARDIPALALDNKPGDVVVFNHNVKHAAFGGGNARRMFTINASERFPAEKIHILRDAIAGSARFWNETSYGPAMLRTATPKRRVHLEQVLANEDHLPALVAKAKLEMSEPSRG